MIRFLTPPQPPPPPPQQQKNKNKNMYTHTNDGNVLIKAFLRIAGNPITWVRIIAQND